MRCANCGKEIADGSRFCRYCGSGTTVAAPSPSSDQIAVAASDVIAARDSSMHANMAHMAQNSDAMVQAMAMYEHMRQRDKQEEMRQQLEYETELATDEYKSLCRTRSNCFIVGIVLAVLAFLGAASAGYEDGGVAMGLMFGTMAFCFPFGFTPIKNALSSWGFFVIFTWMFLIVAALVVFMLSMFIAPIYFIYLQSKIGQAKRVMDAANERLAAYC